MRLPRKRHNWPQRCTHWNVIINSIFTFAAWFVHLFILKESTLNTSPWNAPSIAQPATIDQPPAADAVDAPICIDNAHTGRSPAYSHYISEPHCALAAYEIWTVPLLFCSYLFTRICIPISLLGCAGFAAACAEPQLELTELYRTRATGRGRQGRPFGKGLERASQQMWVCDTQGTNLLDFLRTLVNKQNGVHDTLRYPQMLRST